MAIRRQSLGRIRADEVVHRFELRLTLGSFFSLQIRRTTTTTTITLPSCPLSEIHHWGVLARSEIEDRPDTERPIINLIAAIEAEKARKARETQDHIPERRCTCFKID